MSVKLAILLLISLSIIACSKNSEPVDTFKDCEQISENYKVYDGQEIKCEFHYVLTEYNNQSFIELHAHCADLTRSYVINENCIDICETDPHNQNSECGQYLANREIVEILFIEK